MQKINKSILSLLATLILFSANACAEDEIQSDTKETKYTEEQSVDQDLLSEFLQKTVEYETEKRDLSNQLELEKIRFELAKVKAEIRNTSGNSNDDYLYDYNETQEPIKTIRIEKPKIILFSQIGGLNKFGIYSGGKTTFVSSNERFTDSSGKSYIVKKSGNRYILVSN